MGRRRKDQGDEEGSDTFMLLFCTLSLILLAFFIFMKTLATPDDDRTRAAINSIRRTVEWVQIGGVYPDDTAEESSSLNISDQEQHYRQLERDMVEIVKQQNLGHSSDVAVEMNDREVRIIMADEIIFKPGLSIVNPRSFTLLDRVGSFLDELSRDTIVEGHCDTSGDNVNWNLSSLRAAAVARYLDESAELGDEMIRSRGLAHYHPPRAGHRDPRRVEIVIPYQEGPS